MGLLTTDKIPCITTDKDAKVKADMPKDAKVKADMPKDAKVCLLYTSRCV